MKLISALSVLATLVAAIVLPLRIELVAYFAFTAALGSIWAQDYAGRRPLRFEVAAPTAFQFTARFFFHRRASAGRPMFRAPELASENHRLAA